VTPGSDDYALISSESHIVEPPDLFEGRLPAALADQAPKLATVDDGGAWQVDGAEPIPLLATAATGSGWHRAANGRDAGGPVTWDAVLPSLYDPAERIRAQWADSIDAEVLYPTPGLWDEIRQLDDRALKIALVRAYNDWLAEFCAHDPARLVGLAKLPTTSVDDARAELVRAVEELGLRGAILDAPPSGSTSAGTEADDGFWDAANGLGVPISMHYGFGATESTSPPTGIFPGLKPPRADALLPMAAGGVFDRFPDLKVVFAHGDAGWALHWMEFFDINYVRHKHLSEYALPDPEAVPSDYIRKHAWFTFHQDRPAVKNRQRLGGVHLVWASHFPYEDSNWPDNRQQAMLVTDEAPADERHALLAGNVAKLYRLPGHEKGFTDEEIAAFEQLVHF
jgi:predicted TIM-barrel fold metal-dependent hydrolase